MPSDLDETRRQGGSENGAELGRQKSVSLEMDHMASCVRNNVEPRAPGEEGLQDQILMAAIYQSAQTGKPVSLPAVTHRDAFRGPPLDEEHA